MIKDIFNVIKNYPSLNPLIEKKEQTEENKLFLLNNFKGRFILKSTNNYIKKTNNFIKISYENYITYYIYYIGDKLDINKYISSIKRSYAIIKTFLNKNNFNVYILPQTNKKTLTGNEIIPENINGGFTIKNTNDIFIFRDEESPKVILHEIIHHINIFNFKENLKIKNIEILKKVFNIKKSFNLHLDESIVEFWAIYFTILFLSYEFKIDKNKIYYEELIRSLYLSNKLLQLQNKYKNGEWNEKTNAYCYIIFKTIFLYNINKSLEILINPKEKIIIDFLIKKENSLKFYKYGDYYNLI